MAAAMMAYGYWHLRRHTGPQSQRPSAPKAWQARTAGDWTNARIAGMKPIEQIISPADAQQTAAKTSQQSRKAAPLVLLFAVLLAGVAVHQAVTLARLQSAGQRAEGQVVSLKSEYSSSSHGGSCSYYPIVRYRVPPNLTLEFKDSIGSNPPSYRVGDRVTVLYLPDNPPRQAIIDRGPFWNWTIPAALGAGALFLFWLFLFLRRHAAPAATVRGVAPGPMRFTT